MALGGGKCMSNNVDLNVAKRIEKMLEWSPDIDDMRSIISKAKAFGVSNETIQLGVDSAQQTTVQNSLEIAKLRELLENAESSSCVLAAMFIQCADIKDVFHKVKIATFAGIEYSEIVLALNLCDMNFDDIYSSSENSVEDTSTCSSDKTTANETTISENDRTQYLENQEDAKPFAITCVCVFLLFALIFVFYSIFYI